VLDLDMKVKVVEFYEKAKLAVKSWQILTSGKWK
jgi:hypothetical protein